MIPMKINLSIVRGDYGIYKFTIKKKVKTRKVPVDLTEFDEISFALQLTEEEVIYILVDPADTDNNFEKGIFYIKIPIAISDVFPEEDEMEYDIQFKNPLYRKTIIKGSLKIIADINKT